MVRSIHVAAARRGAGRWPAAPWGCRAAVRGLARLLLGAWLAAGASARAAEVLVETGATTREIFRGLERSGEGARAALAVAADGWRGRAEVHQPFSPGEPSETRLTAGRAWPLAPEWRFEATVTQFLFGGTRAGATEHSWEAAGELAWASPRGWTARAGYARDFRLEADTVHGAVGFEWPLPRLGAYLETAVAAGWADAADVRPDAPGPRRRDGYGYVGVTARVPYRVGEHTTVVVGVEWSGTEGRSRAWSPLARRRAGIAVELALHFDY